MKGLTCGSAKEHELLLNSGENGEPLIQGTVRETLILWGRFQLVTQRVALCDTASRSGWVWQKLRVSGPSHLHSRPPSSSHNPSPPHPPLPTPTLHPYMLSSSHYHFLPIAVSFLQAESPCSEVILHLLILLIHVTPSSHKEAPFPPRYLIPMPPTDDHTLLLSHLFMREYQLLHTGAHSLPVSIIHWAMKGMA